MEKVLKHRASHEAWKRRNYQYYLEQKRRLAARPEYLAHRRMLYRAKLDAARSNAELENRCGEKTTYHEQSASNSQRQHRLGYQPGQPTALEPQWHRVGASGAWSQISDFGEQERVDASRTPLLREDRSTSSEEL